MELREVPMAQKEYILPCPHRQIGAPVGVASSQDLRPRKALPRAPQRQRVLFVGLVEVDIASHSTGLQGLLGGCCVLKVFNCSILDRGEVRSDVMWSCSNQLGLVCQPIDVWTSVFFLDTNNFCRSVAGHPASRSIAGQLRVFG